MQIVNKEYRIVTAPVLIPGVKDCDYTRGETPLTTQQINELMTSFKNYNIIDHDHDFTFPGGWYMKKLGIPLKTWQNQEETTYIDIFDVERTVPPGTWWLKSMITDTDAIQEIDDFKLTSYSLTTANKSFAEKFMKSYNMSTKSITPAEMHLLCKKYNMNFKHRTLIKDIKDPVGFTVSLTGFPCVGGAVFAKKCLETSQTSNKNKGENMAEMINLSFDNLKELLSLKSNKDGENEYVTKEELQETLDESKKQITEDIAKIIDEKIPSDDGDQGKDDTKKQQDDKDDAGDDTKKQQDDKDDAGTQEGQQTDNADQGQDGQVSGKSQPGSKQITHNNDGDDNLSHKHGTPQYKLLKELGRDASGMSKLRL